MNHAATQLTPLILKSAYQIAIGYQQIQTWQARLVKDGDTFQGDLHYYYCGLEGELRQRITEENFLGQSRHPEDPPRLEGYYLVDAVDLAGDSMIPMPWVCSHFVSTRQNNLGSGNKSIEDRTQELFEEHKSLGQIKTREIANLEKKLTDSWKKLETHQAAIDMLRGEKLHLENQLSAVLAEAERQARELGESEEARKQLEEDLASFTPQIRQGVDAIAEKVGPFLVRMLVPLMEDTGPFVHPAPNGARASSGGGQVRTNGQTPSPGPGASDAGVLSPEVASQALYEMLWKNEPCGRFLVEGGLQWAVIRAVVFYAEGMDLGPLPIWPSDVAQDAPPPSPEAAPSPPGA